jgi:hypothetical protein
MPHTLTSTELASAERRNIAGNPRSVGDPGVYLELGELLHDLKTPYREFFAYRWGLGGRQPHTVEATARRFWRVERTMRQDLDTCVWNVAAIARHRELPVARGMLGPNRQRWVERAFQQASRWESDMSRASEARLLLAVGGVDVPDTWPMICEYARSVGIGGLLAPASQTLEEQQREALKVVDGILGHTIWPSDPRGFDRVSEFGCRRPLASWIKRSSGYFQSDRHGRLVQYESMLEREILKALDADPRVTAYQEQPVTIEYTLEDGLHLYTPDVAFRLQGGRVILIEVKPPYELGKLVNWRRWQALYDYCEQHGYGMFIGNPRVSILDHYQASLAFEHTDLVAELAQHGPVAGEDYSALHDLIRGIGIAQAATAALLDWRPKRRAQPLSKTDPADLIRARCFWACIARHAATPR